MAGEDGYPFDGIDQKTDRMVEGELLTSSARIGLRADRGTTVSIHVPSSPEPAEVLR